LVDIWSVKMISVLAFIAFITLVHCGSTEERDRKAFTTFMQKYGKMYIPEEQENRFRIFQANLHEAEKYNNQSKFATFGVSKFLDLTKEEFASRWLMPKYPAQGMAQACLVNGITSPHYAAHEVAAVPETYDWRTQGVVTPVKNQQDCGSCWAFSTTGNIEGQFAIKYGASKLTSFSEQEIVDCSHACCNITGYGPVCNQGCNGGFQWNAMYDIIAWGGLEKESDYPYQGYPNPSCLKQQSKTIPSITKYTCLSTPSGPADEVQMQTYSYQNGPISIALNAQLLMSYSSGIIDPFFPNFWCDPDALDHALLIVGWGSGENWIGETIDYWIVKNSWGTDWGENGYFRMARGENLCGIANSVVSASI